MRKWRTGALVAFSDTTSVLLLLGTNLTFNIVANASFKLSAESPSWRGFLYWQILGNVSGFITVLAFTGILRYLPLKIAYPLTTGLAVVGVQVVAAWWFFHEPVTPRQWLGTLFIMVGIFFIGGR